MLWNDSVSNFKKTVEIAFDCTLKVQKLDFFLNINNMTNNSLTIIEMKEKAFSSAPYDNCSRNSLNKSVRFVA